LNVRHPLTGDPGADARSYKKVDDCTTELTNKKRGVAKGLTPTVCRNRMPFPDFGREGACRWPGLGTGAFRNAH
jgi:hypothetical protein